MFKVSTRRPKMILTAGKRRLMADELLEAVVVPSVRSEMKCNGLDGDGCCF